MANKYGKQVIGTFSAAQILPADDTLTDSTFVEQKGCSGDVEIGVYANTDFVVSTGNYFNIAVECSVDGTNFTVPFLTNSHSYAIHKAVADGALAQDAGELICKFTIPSDEFVSKTHWKLVYSTDEDLQAQKVDAILYGIN